MAKFVTAQEQKSLIEALAADPGDLLLIVAGEPSMANHVLGALRLDLGRPPVTEGGLRLVWVTDFPLFEGMDAEGRLIPAHHPFTMPHPDDLDRLESDPLSVRSQAYDLVLNGWELGSGSVRIHRSDVQQRIFSLLGIDAERAQARFGFLLDAFRHGAPPHAGFAFGIDRLVAHPGRRGEHPRGHRLPQDPVGRRPADRSARSPRAEAAGRAGPAPEGRRPADIGARSGSGPGEEAPEDLARAAEPGVLGSELGGLGPAGSGRLGEGSRGRRRPARPPGHGSRWPASTPRWTLVRQAIPWVSGTTVVVGASVVTVVGGGSSPPPPQPAASTPSRSTAAVAARARRTGRMLPQGTPPDKGRPD